MTEPTFTYSNVDGATFADLRARVLRGSFSSSRYLEDTKAALNDAVLEVCKRLRIHPRRKVCTYGVTEVAGTVALPDNTVDHFWRIEGVWLASASAVADTEDESRIAGWSVRRLAPLDRDPADLEGGTQPTYYTFKRYEGDSTSAGTQGHALPVRLRVGPVAVTAQGRVIVQGYTKPSPMNGDTDFSGLGSDADRALIAYARARLFELEDDDKMAVFWDDRFEQAIRSMAQGGIVMDGPMVTPGLEDEGATAEYGA